MNVISLTLSQSQVEYCRRLVEQLPPGSGQVEVRLSGWEDRFRHTYSDAAGRVPDSHTFSRKGVRWEKSQEGRSEGCITGGGGSKFLSAMGIR